LAPFFFCIFRGIAGGQGPPQKFPLAPLAGVQGATLLLLPERVHVGSPLFLRLRGEKGLGVRGAAAPERLAFSLQVLKLSVYEGKGQGMRVNPHPPVCYLTSYC